MRAVVVTGYGPPEVARVVERPAPQPRVRQALVRLAVAGVESGDARIRGARFPAGLGVAARLAYGWRRPRRPVLGNVFAGVVQQVPAGAAGGLAVGDRVCGMTGPSMGAHAELLAVDAARMVSIPEGVPDDHAAAVLFGGSTALHYLHALGQVRTGDRVLVIGASGSVGTAAVQLAHREGAVVTGVTSAGNAALVRELGAHEVIDHRSRAVSDLDERFDLVLDAVGALGIDDGLRLLGERGRLLLPAAGLGGLLRARGRIKAGPAPERTAGFAELLRLLAAGEHRAVIDRRVPVAEIADAYARVDSGRKVGAVLVTF